MIDDAFPSIQCVIAEYAAPYRLDRNWNKGGILLYIREDIPSIRDIPKYTVSLSVFL